MAGKSSYSKGVYDQLEEVMARLSVMETSHKKGQEEIKHLNSIVRQQEKKIGQLSDTVRIQAETIECLEQENACLKKENQLLRDDNDRMKRILNNNSTNSSLPPSSDQAKSSGDDDQDDGNGSGTGSSGKPANQYNGRTASKKKKGGQPGHRGITLTRMEVEQKIKDGVFQHRIRHIGKKSGKYITRYVLDTEVVVTATEVRIYADKDGKFQVPKEYVSDVTYGSHIRAMISCLYSEGVVSNDRICSFINSITDDTLSISEGTVYHICSRFSDLCERESGSISSSLQSSPVLCTDAAYMSCDGKRAYIRNFSNDHSVLYVAMPTKKLSQLEKIELLKGFTGILEHDHETALYHFGLGNAECNVHLERYLLKNTEETGNRWSHHMSMFLKGMNSVRKKLKAAGISRFAEKALIRYEARYDEILVLGEKEAESTRGRYNRQEEKKLLNRLKKYKENHLLFLHHFEVPYSDNMSERDLRKCKNRQKMSGGFRSMTGMAMYCSIMSFIETVKRRSKKIFQSIVDLHEGRPVFS